MYETKTFKGSITAKGTEITVISKGTDNDYISLTDSVVEMRGDKRPAN